MILQFSPIRYDKIQIKYIISRFYFVVLCDKIKVKNIIRRIILHYENSGDYKKS